MKHKVSVIDLFAGPGGLGEGFSNCKPNSPFQIRVSIECEKNAHETLTLRSFFRKLTESEKRCYYDYVGSATPEDKQLRKNNMTANLREKWNQAEEETLGTPHALGNPEKWKRIKAGLKLRKKDKAPTLQEESIYRRIDEIKASSNGPVIVIGGPPCQSYSVNGRNRIKADKKYTPENDERFFLYQEYLKVIDRAEPDLFIMENVEGITSAKLATGEKIFEKIKRELRRPENLPGEQYAIYSLVASPDNWEGDNPTYRDNKSYCIIANDFGVPQKRKRIILLGIKKKYGKVNSTMRPHPSIKAPKIADIIANLPTLMSGFSNRKGESIENNQVNWNRNWKKNLLALKTTLKDSAEIEFVVSRIVRQANISRINRNLEPLSDTETDRLRYKHREEVEIGYKKVLSEIQKLERSLQGKLPKYSTGNAYCLKQTRKNTFSAGFASKFKILSDWLDTLPDKSMILNHGTRDHMLLDLQRYMFCAIWAKAHSENDSPSPKSKYFPAALSPDHDNWETGNHADRFRAIEAHQVPLTITSHLRKDGHAQIHYDPVQNRSLTPREAARIQSFPDNYYFEGTQGWQFQQIGNAVPPFLAKQIALFVLEIMKKNKVFN